MKTVLNNKPRLYLLDTVRGITLLSMILYHTLWDLVYIYRVNLPWYRGTVGYVWQQSICWTFILLSGFCVGLGRNTFKRGIIVFLGGVLVSLVTYLFMRENVVAFGILTFMGIAMIFVALTEKILIKINTVIGMAVSAVVFFIMRNINDGWLGFENLKILKLPDFLYKNYITAFLGFPHREFYSSDYFPFLPWIFLFLTGYFLYKILEKHKERLFSKGKVFLLSFIGRHTLIIYLLHQPLIYGILYLIYNI